MRLGIWPYQIAYEWCWTVPCGRIVRYEACVPLVIAVALRFKASRHGIRCR
jgi:hypothetical protein